MKVTRAQEDSRKRRRDTGESKRRKNKMKKRDVDQDTTSPVSGTFIRRLSDVQPFEIKKGKSSNNIICQNKFN